MPRSFRMLRAVVVLTTATAALAACSSATPEAIVRLTPTPVSPSGVQEGITYRTVDGEQLKLDACLPPADDATPDASQSSTAGSPVVVILHGGGFTSGSRSTGGSRTICQLVAGYGFAAFSVDYRLVAQGGTFPAPVDDVQHAIEWLREAAQVSRFGIDPSRIALLGSSAGAILAQTVATAGSGSLATGSRVKAVVSLSGVSELTPAAAKVGDPTPDLVKIILDYLGCTSIESCKDADDASAIRHVDSSDPPMLLVNSTREIVPVQQPEAMRDALAAAKVPVQLVLVPGSAHGFSVLDASVRDAIKVFLAKRL